MYLSLSTKYWKTLTTTSCMLLSKFRGFSTASSVVNSKVAKDVILYKYENPKFFKYLNLCAIVQFGFWTYLSSFAYTGLKDAPLPDVPNPKWYQKINLGDDKYRNTLTVTSFLIGYGFLVVAWMYTLRSVRYLVLRKGGKEVSFVTYTPAGQNRILTVNLENVSARGGRISGASLIPIKVKNKMFYYVLDKNGEFKNPILFDVTAGIQRALL